MVAGKTGVCQNTQLSDADSRIWMVYAPVESTGWSLAAVIPESEVMAPIYARLLRFLWLLAAGLVVILAIVLLVSIRVTGPLGRLAAAADSLGSGNLDARVPDMAAATRSPNLPPRSTPWSPT